MSHPSHSRKARQQENNRNPERENPAILFDLDGTLLDSNYEHVAAWRQALREEGLEIPDSRIHRCIGMSGRLLVRTLFAEKGKVAGPRMVDRLEKLHQRNFRKRISSVQPLPGARQILAFLSGRKIQWAIATGGDQKTVGQMIKPLRVPESSPVITADHVRHAKPSPDVFLEAAERLGFALSDCIVVGDSVWDLLGARRAKALGVGLLCGGYGAAELEQAGAYRVYKDPLDLLNHIGELGVQPT
ncbi:MAG: HAD family hydrolase [Acidipila sp.]|nr:HAD family hydrolase [Acidipila sp.]